MSGDPRYEPEMRDDDAEEPAHETPPRSGHARDTGELRDEPRYNPDARDTPPEP